MTKKPKTFSPQEKTIIAVAAIKGDKTIAQISSEYQVHPTQIGLWRRQALDNMPEIMNLPVASHGVSIEHEPKT